MFQHQLLQPLPSYSHLPGTTTRGGQVFYMKGFCSLPLKPGWPVLSVSVSASLEAVICWHLGKSVLASHLSLSESWKFKEIACNIQEEKAFVMQLTCGMLESIPLPSSLSAPWAFGLRVKTRSLWKSVSPSQPAWHMEQKPSGWPFLLCVFILKSWHAEMAGKAHGRGLV